MLTFGFGVVRAKELFALFVLVLSRLIGFIIGVKKVVVEVFNLKLGSLVKKRLLKSHAVECLHNEVSRLLAQVSIKRDLAHNVLVVGQIKASQDLVFQTSLVKVVRNG